MSDDVAEAVRAALDFVEALTQRRYEDAIALTASDFIDEGGAPLGVGELREKFEQIVPTDWVFVDFDQIFGAHPPPPEMMPAHVRGPLTVMQPETDWVEPPDVAFVYVGIADEMEGEGVAVFVCREGADLRIREITFGRP